MQSETHNERRVQVRYGRVVKECKMLFPKELGGDIVIEPGDDVVLLVRDTEKKGKDELTFEHIQKIVTHSDQYEAR